MRRREIEVRVLRLQGTDLRSRISDGRYVVKPTANPLRVVEKIEEIRLEFNSETFRQRETLNGSQVDIIDGGKLQGVGPTLANAP